MANTLQTQIVENGPRNFVVAVQIAGDGSGDISNTQLFSAPTGVTNMSIWKATGSFHGFGAILTWGATTTASRRQALVLNDAWGSFDLKKEGGLLNSVSASARTNTVLLRTSGLGSGDYGTMFLRFHKQ